MRWRQALSRLERRLPRRLRQFARRTDAVAAVEFAIILPLMLFIYMGTASITEAVSASRSVVILARTLSDITSQQPASVNLTDSTVQDIFGSATAVLAPFPTTGLKMTLSNVEFVANAASTGSNGYDAKTRWTVGWNTSSTLRPCSGNPLLTPVANGTAPSPSTIPVGLYSSGFLIVADVTYTYTPTFGIFSWDFVNRRAGTGWSPSFTMTRTTYMRPRQTDNIRYDSAGSATICPIASPQQP